MSIAVTRPTLVAPDPTALVIAGAPHSAVVAAVETRALIEVTVGPRNAHTDPRTGLRFYRWDDVDYPSVTSIRRMAGLPFFLHEWTISQVVNRAVEQHGELTAMLTRDRRPRERVLEKNRLKEAKTWLRKAAIEERDRAADLGTRVHDHATKGVALIEADADVAAKLHQFYDFLYVSGAEIIAVERQVWNLTLGYAGTFDLLLYFPHDWVDPDTGEIRARAGEYWLVDLKTGKRTYTEHALQLIAYCMAEFIGEDNVRDPRLSDLLQGVNGMALLHLEDEHWKWQAVEPTTALFRAFQGLLTFSKFAHANQQIEELVSGESEGSA